MPAELGPGKDAWTFRMPQSNAVMSIAIVDHMARNGVKTVGFLGSADAYGESWLNSRRSPSGAAMPNRAVVERGYKGKIYQTHAAGTRDLMRLGGKEVDGTYVVSGPVIAPEQLPDSNPSKKLALRFVQQYEQVYGAGTRNQFAGHAFDMNIVLQKAIPIALKKAKPGTPEFRRALRDALETMGRPRSRTACSTGPATTTGATSPRPA